MTSQAGKAVFIDTNILVYCQLALSPFHQVAQARLKDFQTQGSSFWVSRQIFREYVSVMSRPGVVTGNIPIVSLTNDVRSFAMRFNVAEDSSQTTVKWLSLIEQIPTAGKQVHDANIVATMLTNGIQELLTHNVSDFVRFAGLVTVTPLII
ncbi:MAG TPA: type II toxin-antitoxin system VapC family toxin [Blastocatellia bacterium]|nr:type II toxin-antitoxin system VapC family toxin [Blastocatellia bacterium]